MEPKAYITMKRLFSEYRTVAMTLLILVLILIAVGIWAITASNNPSTNNATSATSNRQLVIKELGVAITLPTALQGTTYQVVKPHTASNFKYNLPPMVNLELKQYSKLAGKCLGNSDTNYPFASLSRVAGKAPASDKTVLKQFDSFYIDEVEGGINPQCPNDLATQQAVDSLQNSLSDGLRTSFASAQKI